MYIMTARFVLGRRRVELRGKEVKLTSAKVRQRETGHAILEMAKSYESPCRLGTPYFVLTVFNSLWQRGSQSICCTRLLYRRRLPLSWVVSSAMRAGSSSPRPVSPTSVPPRTRGAHWLTTGNIGVSLHMWRHAATPVSPSSVRPLWLAGRGPSHYHLLGTELTSDGPGAAGGSTPMDLPVPGW